MNFIIGLVAGLLIGWLIEWVVDWLYWRKRARVTVTDTEPDRLEDIYGIGPVIGERFRKAGVKTFAELSTLNEDEVREIAKAEEWQHEPTHWISQAKDFARRRREEREGKK